jgi:DUF1009 family protein
MPRLAIIAGQGALPRHLALADPGALVFAVRGQGVRIAGREVEEFHLERLAPLFARLHDLGVERVVLAGAMQRPRLDPQLVDPMTARMLPGLLAAMQGGDDGLLRAVIGEFEAAGLAVVGAEAVAPDLLPPPGVPTRAAPSEADRRDAGRAAAVVAALGAADVGQGAVVAQGLVLAVEALPGTDAMLAWVRDVAGACRPDPRGAKGLLLKAAKPGQDRRIDLPAVGPLTVAGAAAAGLAGIVIEAGGVILTEPEATLAAADAAGLFVWVRPRDAT